MQNNLLETEYLNLAGAAEFTGLNISTLRRLINEPGGDLPHVRLSPRGRVLFSRVALASLMEKFTRVGPFPNPRPHPQIVALVGQFVAARCTIAPGRTVTARKIYEAYVAWAAACGFDDQEKLRPRGLGVCLSVLGFEKGRGGAGLRLWRGLGLLVV